MEKLKRAFNFIFTHPLGRRHPGRSLMRFVKWQVQTLLSPSRWFVKNFLPPVKFYVKKGAYGLTGNIYTGLHEFSDMAFLLHFLRAGDAFIDVGANAGSFTLLASGVCKAITTAIEPVKSTFDHLSKNVELNNLQIAVSLVNACAGAAQGSLQFSTDEDTTNHVIASSEFRSGNTVTVPVITVDSLSLHTNPTLIKIDVEGFETEVLKGMEATFPLSSLKAIIIELNGSGTRYGFNEANIHSLLLAKNFRPYQYDPFSRLLTEMPSYGNHNTIYCRDLPFVNERVQGANSFKTMGELI